MKRHPALQDLSRDHHDVLLHARRLRGDDPRVDAQTASARFLLYHEAVLAHHFAEEETILAPYLSRELANRMIDEHNDLRRLAAALANGGDAKSLGMALRSHVRFEEDVLFQHLQKTLTAVDWDALQAAHVAAGFRPGPPENCFL